MKLLQEMFWEFNQIFYHQATQYQIRKIILIAILTENKNYQKV